MHQPDTRRPLAIRVLRTMVGVLAAGIFGLFVFCAGGGVLLVWGAQRAVVHVRSEMTEAQRQHQVAAVNATTSAFLHEIRVGNTSQAYDRLSRSFRERQSLAEWQEWLGDHPIGKELGNANRQVNSLDSADTARCRMILVTGGGFEVGAVLDLVKEEGRWAVDRIILH